MHRRFIIPCIILLSAFTLAVFGVTSIYKAAWVRGATASSASIWPASSASYPGQAIWQDAYPVDPLFAEFFEALGGAEILGPAISPVITEGPIRKQYLQTALLVSDQAAPPNHRFSLGLLGSKYLRAEDQAGQLPAQARKAGNEFPVSPVFLKMYENLGGARLVGRPITGIRYDVEKQRAEQLFENLGLFRMDQDPPGVAHLMPLGAYDCDYRCRRLEPAAAIPIREADLPDPFQSRIRQLGPGFTGRLLAGPYATPDGGQEAIFENLVLVAGAGSAGPAQAKPITELLGFERQPPKPAVANDLYVFYEIQDGRGFLVPKLFTDYLGQHGGVEFSGLPTGEVFQLETGIYSQCFSSFCLEFDPSDNEGQQLSPLPLGARYKSLIYDGEADFSPNPPPASLELAAWVEPKPVDSHATAQVFVSASEAGLPLVNWEPTLSVSLPDGSMLERRFPPTGADGQTMLSLEPVPAPTGTLIIYEVCLEAFQGARKCVEQSYLIWNSE